MISFLLDLFRQFLLSSLTRHWFNLETLACSVFALSSYFLLRIDATFQQPLQFFFFNVLSKTRILIIPPEADGLVPPAPPSSSLQNKFSSWPNSLDFALAFYSFVQNCAVLKSHIIMIPASKACHPGWKWDRPRRNQRRISHLKGEWSACSWLSSVRNTENSDYQFLTHPQSSE